MSITCDWLAASQLAIVDKLNGRATLVHVLETVTSPRFPAQVPTFHVVATWRNATEMIATARLRVRIDEAAGDPGPALLDEEVTFVGRTSHRSICIVQSLTVLRPGLYRVVASRQCNGEPWVDMATFPFHVAPSPGSGQTAQA
ncbi:MAG: hypothetical protein FJ100_17405 [Deltaproteobacteria bacterium]|nr:hypothetical protein [Deltaproteobacteria bacterium]